MENQKLIGIGCFAKPATLCRIFRKMVQSYTLGPFDLFELINGQDAMEADGTILLKALFAGKAECFHSPDSESRNVVGNKKITGFFLTLKDQRLKLSIFARGGSPKEEPKEEKFTTSLDELTKIRQKRLN